MRPGRVVAFEVLEDFVEFGGVDIVTLAGEARMGGRVRSGGERAQVREHGYEDRSCFFRFPSFFRFPISGSLTNLDGYP